MGGYKVAWPSLGVQQPPRGGVTEIMRTETTSFRGSRGKGRDCEALGLMTGAQLQRGSDGGVRSSVTKAPNTHPVISSAYKAQTQRSGRLVNLMLPNLQGWWVKLSFSHVVYSV